MSGERSTSRTRPGVRRRRGDGGRGGGGAGQPAGGTIEAGDGRALGYAECGDPGGRPVLYFHGLPGSRLDWSPAAYQTAALGLGVRLVAVERPGFGLSDDCPGRGYAHWPSDVVAVADRLGLDRFALLGYSCGGPYALACAALLAERVTDVVVLSPVGPPDTPGFRDGLGGAGRLMIPLARRAPWLARIVVARARRSAVRDPAGAAARVERLLSDADRAYFRRPEVMRHYRQMLLEATARGPAGYVREYVLWGRRWDFDLGEVRTRVHLHYGALDETVPLAHAEHLARVLPNASLRIAPAEAHLATPERYRAALGELT